MSATPLGQDLIALLSCSAALVDAALAAQPSDVLELSLEELSRRDDELTTSVIGRITAEEKLADARRVETCEEIMKASTRAIFAYGTLRGDYSTEGDHWGMISAIRREHGCECAWRRGVIRGYALHQDTQLHYPFATTASEDASIVGTVLTWPGSHDAFADALQRCNSIERYRPDGKGLYNRAVVSVQCDDGEKIEAYMYFQQKAAKELASCRAFPSGDWLA